MKIITNRILASALLVVMTAACTPAPNSASGTTVSRDGTATVTGAALYRERIMPPPGASIQFTLEDVSRADAPSVTLASQSYKLEGKGQPYAFHLTTPRNTLDPRMRYNLRVAINDPSGKLLWISDTANTVNPEAVDQELPQIILVKVN